MDGRDNRYIKEVFNWSRDALDLEVSELNELVESMTRLNGLQVKSEKSWKVRRTCIVERNHDEEIQPRMTHVLRTRTSVQMGHSEDAIGTK